METIARARASTRGFRQFSNLGRTSVPATFYTGPTAFTHPPMKRSLTNNHHVKLEASLQQFLLDLAGDRIKANVAVEHGLVELV